MNKQTNPEIKQFIDYAYQEHQRITGEKLYITGRSGKTAERMLQTFNLEELKGLWDKFLQMEDDFVAEAGYSIPVFESVLNKLITGQRKKRSAMDTLTQMEVYDDEGRDQKDNIIPLRRIS